MRFPVSNFGAVGIKASAPDIQAGARFPQPGRAERPVLGAAFFICLLLVAALAVSWRAIVMRGS